MSGMNRKELSGIKLYSENQKQLVIVDKRKFKILDSCLFLMYFIYITTSYHCI